MLSINTKYTKGTTTYDVGSSQIITVPDTGTYDAQIKSGTDFNLKSTTIPATSSTGLYTWAFHHGNFDNAYGDGDILTARDNGPVSYTHLRAHETDSYLVCRLLLEKK